MESCPCIKSRDFDLTVTNRGCEHLVIEDASVWMGAQGYEKPETFQVTFESPTRGSSKVLTLKTDARNTFTSIDLFGTTNIQCIADDVYCIRVTSCGYDLTINRAVVCTLQIELNKLIVKFAETLTKDERDTISDLKTSIGAVKLNAEKGNVKTAKKLFKIVKAKLKAATCNNC